MLTYKIRTADPENNRIVVTYSNTAGEKFQLVITDADFSSEEAIHNAVKQHAVTAQRYFSVMESRTPEVSLSERTGTAKPVVEMPLPNHDPRVERLEPRWTEQEDAMILSHEKIVLEGAEREEAISIQAFGAREYRDEQLRSTDHWMLPDTDGPTQEQLDYRQALRDLPSQEGFPLSVVWPVRPE